MKNLFAILLIAASVGIAFGYARPIWSEIQSLRQEESKYSEALKRVEVLNAALENQKALIASIPPADLERLEKLLPDNVDNVKLIIDINNIASSEGMSIRDISIATPKDDSTSRSASAVSSRAGYDYIDLSFKVNAQYGQFLKFITSLEQSLRLVDIINVSFVPGETGSGTYDFAVTIRTYWLK